VEDFDFYTTDNIGNEVLIDNTVRGVYVGYMRTSFGIYFLFAISSYTPCNNNSLVQSPIQLSLAEKGFLFTDNLTLERVIADNSTNTKHSFNTSLYNPTEHKQGIWIELSTIHQYNIRLLNTISNIVKQIDNELL
jgi:hypothetical protein